MTDTNEDLVTQGFADIEPVKDRPKAIAKGDVSGTENIGVDDLRLPRLAIAQGLSPQMMPDDSSHIPGLALFDLFNDLTGEIYGRGPITFVPVRRDERRIEFTPRDEGGGIVDLDVPRGDPRTKWTKDEVTGERTPPVATKFIEFVAYLLHKGRAPEPIVISIKDTNKFNRRASEQLTAFIKFRNAPIYSGLYTVTTKSEKNDNGTFGVYVMKNAGFIPVDTPSGKALFEYAKAFHDSLIGKEIIVNREPGVDDFDTAEMEREAAEQQQQQG